MPGAALFAICLTLAAAIGPSSAAAASPPRIGDPAPEISGAPWINSPPLTAADLRGKVVLVEFWTYG